MKKLLILYSLIALSIHFPAMAQKETAYHAVAVKWAPAGIVFGKITLGSEYSLSTKSAVTFVVGIPFNKTLSHDFDNEKESLTHKTFSIIGGYRLYIGKGNGHGLYFEPYIKYLKYDVSSTVDADIEGTSRDFALTGAYSGVGVGGQLGAQFLLARKFVIDFYFLGPEATTSKTDVLMQELGSRPPWNSQAAADAEKEIRDVIDDIPIIKNKADINVNANQRNVTARYNGFLPGYRIGLSFGWKFGG